jgi:riboflavin kinase/FMN adenylyltransferase
VRITPLPEVVRRPRRVAVGEFDGVHLGHREVIRGADTVLTFEPHPRAVLTPEAAPRLLTTLARKAELVAELGVEEVVVIPFDRAFAARSPEDFVDRVLVGALGAVHVAVGASFRFGHRARGDAALLAAQDAFATRVVPLVEVDGRVVSSTQIRALVAGGDVAAANRLLGAPFELRGTVVHGDHRGRTLGYPTANLVPDPQLVCPAQGVYAGHALIDGERVPAATSVGVRPQFEQAGRVLVETHLLDWSGDLYGRELRVRLETWLRGEERFPSVDDLLAQMARDVEAARRLGAGARGAPVRARPA